MGKISDYELQKEESIKLPMEGKPVQYQYGFYLGGEKDYIAWVWATNNKQAMHFYKNKMLIVIAPGKKYLNPNRNDIFIEAIRLLDDKNFPIWRYKKNNRH